MTRSSERGPSPAEAPSLRGHRGPSRAYFWFLLPVVLVGVFGTAARVADSFEESAEAGTGALLTVVFIVGGCAALMGIIGAILELVAYARARNASGVRYLVPMQLTVNSYQQAFDLVGDAVFLPAKDQGVLLALRDDRIEIYAGLSEYSGPRMGLPYADITGIERRRVRVYAGDVPGIAFECAGGVFELGFVRTVVFRPLEISKGLAERRYREIESAIHGSGRGPSESKAAGEASPR